MGKKRMNTETAITGTVSLQGTEQLKVRLQSFRVIFIASSTSMHKCVPGSALFSCSFDFFISLYTLLKVLYASRQFLHTSE